MVNVHPEAALRFDQLGEDLLGHVKPAGSEAQPSSFQPDIFPFAQITKEDIIGPIRMKSSIINGEGEEVGRVIEELKLSLEGDDYKALKNLAFAMLRSTAIAEVASAEYIIDQIWEWIEHSVRNGVKSGIANFIEDALDRDVIERELWFPLHRVHSEIEPQIGLVKFKTIDGTMMQHWLDRALAIVPELDQGKVTEHYRRLRSKMQGSLAAVVRVRGEPRKARQSALDSAQMAVSMLRFASPANFSPRIRSYATLLGEEAIPSTITLTIMDGDLTQYEESSDGGQHAWFIKSCDLAQLPRTLIPLLSDLASHHNNDYGRHLYDALLIYSRNSIAKETSDKLVFIMVALESMLLRDGNEPIQKNVGERMAFIAGQTVDERKAIVKNLSEVYNLRSKFVHHGQSAEDIEPLYPFMVNAWTCFCNLLGWQKRFKTKGDLISWLEDRKLAG